MTHLTLPTATPTPTRSTGPHVNTTTWRFHSKSDNILIWKYITSPSSLLDINSGTPTVSALWEYYHQKDCSSSKRQLVTTLSRAISDASNTKIPKINEYILVMGSKMQQRMQVLPVSMWISHICRVSVRIPKTCWFVNWLLYPLVPSVFVSVKEIKDEFE